jgi:epoxyqueuosine reductase
MTYTQKLKEFLLKQDIDYVGIAPVERFVNAPEGHRPGDILPGARSVISIGIKMNRGPLLTQRVALANKKLRHVAFSYRWFAYGLENMYFLDQAAFQVTRLLQSEGEIALPIVTSGVEGEDNGELMGLLSNRHAAVAAGLGEMGWNGLCLTPDNGPRQRFVSVITTANLDPDPMYQGHRLCKLKECVERGQGLPLCVKLCPLKVFSAHESVEAVIGGRKFVYASMDHITCALSAGSGLHPEALGPDGLDLPAKMTFADMPKIMPKIPARSIWETTIFRRAHACGICLLRCPVGADKEIDEIMKHQEVGKVN